MDSKMKKRKSYGLNLLLIGLTNLFLNFITLVIHTFKGGGICHNTIETDLNSQIEMVVLEHFNCFLKTFSFFGQSPISTATVEETKLKTFTNLIPVLLSSVLSICIAIFLSIYPHFTNGPIEIILTFLSLLSSLLVILTANWQCYYHKSIYQNAIYRIQQLENSCRNKFSANLPFQSMAIHYRRKVLLIYIIFLVSQGLVLGEACLISTWHALLSSVLTSLIRSMYPIAVLHFTLYSDIIAVVLQEMNQQIQNSPNDFHSSKLKLLQIIKLMHLDLWKLVVQINTYFGWNLLMLIVNAFIFITYQLYYIFLMLQNKWNVLGLIEGSTSLLYGMSILLILVNSCQSCWLQVKHLIENIEQYVFSTMDDVDLHNLKQGILSQINNLSMNITARDFFNIDRQFLARIAASCCMYIIIFIQFFLASEMH